MWIGDNRNNLPPLLMPLTATSETVRSAFFRVSLVVSIGPLLYGAVAEIDRTAWKPVVGTATRVLKRGAKRAVNMMKLRCFELFELDKIFQLELISVDRLL